MDRKMVCD